MTALFPDTDWDYNPTAAHADQDGELQAAVARAGRRGAAALMVVRHGQVIASRGDLATKLDMASARKSLISALYGILVGEGAIDLNQTIGDFDIDDNDPLTDAEKRATIRDLLLSSSGVYRPAAAEGLAMKLKRPRRGRYAPGEHWYYNNWDFNVLGTILEQVTGASVHDVFEERIARPIGMQDYTTTDGFYRTITRSRHRAYRFVMSTRDMARFGLLFARGGCWDDRQVVPVEWVTDSTTEHIADAKGPFGYGYCWWIGKPQHLAGHNFYLARGGLGHAIAVVPDLDLVVVHRVRTTALSRKLRVPFFLGWLAWRRVGPRPRPRPLPATTLDGVLNAVLKVPVHR